MHSPLVNQSFEYQYWQTALYFSSVSSSNLIIIYSTAILPY